MHWLALHWSWPEPARAAPPDWPTRDTLAWWALGFTPHVAWVGEALLLEVSVCERLWGGRQALWRLVSQTHPAPGPMQKAHAATSLVALGRLRWRLRQAAVAGQRWPEAADLPLDTLDAARPHLPALAGLGCRRWGQLEALPRAGLARRFGPGLGRALDIAFGRAPDVYAWLQPPERFEQSLELPERADSAPALLWAARRLLQALQAWLVARQQGVLVLQLAWAFDQRRRDGRPLPPEDSLELRTAQPVQGMAHLQRLLGERLARTPLQAPVRALRLRVLQSAPWQPASASLLPEEQPRGDPLHMFVERVGARLGAASLRTPVLAEDHRPECRQGWQPVEQLGPRAGVGGSAGAVAGSGAGAAPPTSPHDALAPAWLLRPALALALQDGQPCHQGQPLRLVAGPHRIETGWWPEGPATPAARDYFIAQGATAELLWVYRERPLAGAVPAAAPRWFLQGFYV